MDSEKGIHKDKCRLCLCRLSGVDDIFYEINGTIEHRFETLTSLQLESTHLLSNNVCASCDENLTKYDVFREELIKKQSKLIEILRKMERIVDQPTEEPELEYIYEETLEENPEVAEDAQSLSSQIEYIETDTEDSTMDQNLAASSSSNKTLSRPKAWQWTDEMETDLVKYFQRYKTSKASDSNVFGKISRKFQAKGYPNISAKSIRYKYEKTRVDSKRLVTLEKRAIEAVDSDEVSDQDETIQKRKQIHGRKTYWSEEMEVSLLFLVIQERRDQPALSENNLYRNVSSHFQQAGFRHIHEHNVCYHMKKLKSKNPDRILYLESKAKQLKEPFPGSSHMKQDYQTPSNKRKYLHWTTDMKQALIEHREGLSRGIPSGLIWETVANQMESDGYGTFTPKNVMHKYFNIRRQK